MGRQLIIKGADFSANAYTNIEGILPYRKLSAKAVAVTCLDENSGQHFGRTFSNSSYSNTVYGVDVSKYVGQTISFSGARFVKAATTLSHGGITATTSYNVLITDTELASVEVNTAFHYYNTILTEWPTVSTGESLSEFTLTIPEGAKCLMFDAPSYSTPLVEVVPQTNE